LSSDTLRSVADSLRIFPSVNRPVVSRALTGAIRNVHFDVPRNRVYVLRQTSSESVVTVLDGTTYDVTDSWPVIASARDMDLTPSGDSLIVGSHFNTRLCIIDLTASLPSCQVVPLTHPNLGSTGVWGSLLAGSGKVYIGAAIAMFEVSLPSLAVRQLQQSNSLLLARSNDGNTIVRRSEGRELGVLHPGDSAFVNTSGTIGEFSPSVSSNGARIGDGLLIFNGSLALVRAQFAVGATAPNGHPQISPDGNVLAYLDLARTGFIRSSITTGFAIERVSLPQAASGDARIRFAADGSRAAIFEFAGTQGQVQFVDLR
jgi:hypothetical protein